MMSDINRLLAGIRGAPDDATAREHALVQEVEWLREQNRLANIDFATTMTERNDAIAKAESAAREERRRILNEISCRMTEHNSLDAVAALRSLSDWLIGL